MPEDKIIVTGNTVIDALYWVVDKIKNDKALDIELDMELKCAGYDVGRLSNGEEVGVDHRASPGKTSERALSACVMPLRH